MYILLLCRCADSERKVEKQELLRLPHRHRTSRVGPSQVSHQAMPAEEQLLALAGYIRGNVGVIFSAISTNNVGGGWYITMGTLGSTPSNLDIVGGGGWYITSGHQTG